VAAGLQLAVSVELPATAIDAGEAVNVQAGVVPEVTTTVTDICAPLPFALEGER
jgi:hypothetical protein